MRRRNLCIVLLSVGAALVVAGYFFSHSRRGRVLLEIYRKSRYEDFTISGHIVDETGAPLEGVTMYVSAGRLKKAGTETEYDSDYIKLMNSKFVMQRKGYSSVRLEFFLKEFDTPYRNFPDSGTYKDITITMRRLPAATTRSTTRLSTRLSR